MPYDLNVLAWDVGEVGILIFIEMVDRSSLGGETLPVVHSLGVLIDESDWDRGRANKNRLRLPRGPDGL